ncbi:DarT ssDNA thymidine ADP-ribosyltransferase family protein [Sphingomonas sp.]|uniref:DarT ssDNA thymidine ADP-ribosyltransferase family protein n=1 Tax=Sphingomonas sp. TaxID=28214 RepID=UPI00258F8AD9|nr:DarT ssDNA thymidine ADP-ribosyltransferase family protein [Sphingomonas sp.]
MSIEEFIHLLRTNCQQNTFFHFTATQNVRSIREHGLLTMAEIRNRGTEHIAGGNELSQNLDVRRGMDRFVHLCFRKQHGMAHQAVKEGRIPQLAWLRILPEIANTPGVMVALNNAVMNDVRVMPLDAAINEMDLEVLYTRTDWADAAIQERLRRAERYELLIPNGIPPAYIR